MPQTGMDWWVIVGVIAAIIAVVFAWLQYRKRGTRTVNSIVQGDNNQQTGGKGTTENTVERGSGNNQSG